MQREPATFEETREHGWCLQLRGSQAFKYFLHEVARKESLAHRNVCAEDAANREYQAGRLSAFSEVQQIIEKRYAHLKPIVEVVPE